MALRENQARQARFQAGADSTAAPPACTAAAAAAAKTARTAAELAARLHHPHDDKENGGDKTLVKKDFFGRVIQVRPLAELNSQNSESQTAKKRRKVWVTYHEGLNNAVRKPISMAEFLKPL